MELDLEIKQDTLLVRPKGELDLVVADEFRTILENALDNRPINFLVLNLSQVSFIDSSCLGVILGRYKRLAQVNGRVSLVSAQPQVRRVLEMSGFFRIMREYSGEEEALNYIFGYRGGYDGNYQSNEA
jgi:stage II sporulation protein AA (anti-sigma F factor antagonist)